MTHDDALGRLRREVERLQLDLASAGRQSENLQAALESNRRIGMAIGILMASRRLTEQAAFDCLREVSNARNVKLRVVAEQVIYEGALEQPSPQRLCSASSATAMDAATRKSSRGSGTVTV